VDNHFLFIWTEMKKKRARTEYLNENPLNGKESKVLTITQTRSGELLFSYKIVGSRNRLKFTTDKFGKKLTMNGTILTSIQELHEKFYEEYNRRFIEMLKKSSKKNSYKWIAGGNGE